MFIRTERLFLRPVWPEDWQELKAAIADERVVRNLARAPWPYTDADAQAFVALPQDRLFPRFLTTVPGARGSRIVGGIGLMSEQGRAEIGYWLAPDAWGRGYATEAASAVLRLARTLGHRCVGAWHFLDNPASGRVLEKIGLRGTGLVTERSSLGRTAPAPSRECVVRFTGSSDCDDGSTPEDGLEPGMRAA
jgi:RimJ/RimL family protein N-acetyltransferase